MAHPRLQTERLLLREFRIGDLDAVVGYATREEFYRYLPIPVPTEASTIAFVKERIREAMLELHGSYTFAIELVALKRVIGAVRLTTEDIENEAASIGYALDPDHWGNGYMSEAVRAVVGYGFDGLKLHRIWATADPENEASWRLMERLGMRREGLLREDKLIRGTWRDSYLYAILAQEKA